MKKGTNLTVALAMLFVLVTVHCAFANGITRIGMVGIPTGNVDNFTNAKLWYAEHLGFKVKWEMKDPKSGKHTLLMMTLPGKDLRISFTDGVPLVSEDFAILNLYTPCLQPVFDRLKKDGVEIIEEPTAITYPDGVHIHCTIKDLFGQAIVITQPSKQCQKR